MDQVGAAGSTSIKFEAGAIMYFCSALTFRPGILMQLQLYHIGHFSGQTGVLARLPPDIGTNGPRPGIVLFYIAKQPQHKKTNRYRNFITLHTTLFEKSFE
jgi:hypothetical protein